MTETKYYFPNQVINSMNIPFTIKLATRTNDDVIQGILEQVTYTIKRELNQVDKEFSPFRSDSLLVKFQNGDLDPLLKYDSFQSVFVQSKLAEEMTDNYFSAHFEDKYDPTGIVKGWVIEKSFESNLRELLDDPDIDGVSLNGGGDMKFATKKNVDFRWGIGIEDPNDLQNIATSFYLKNGAVATSGMNKRGQHIVQNNSSNIQQVTVISSSLVDADVWATAGISAGTEQFSKMIWNSRLTGVLFDQEEGQIHFRNGVLKHAQKTSF
ncbi:FAD:protein FMN transferase [Companilactobacillus keshanensis]|uniref:FAD:protein FMN transferase n=1 Tax=Companilactobacillus keshanensis TaxID=2486003 RepID=A0ABW4BSB3_9LACO|nr:FAD:protein FMN transferase [Companilactobacillus keshanensis]